MERLCRLQTVRKTTLLHIIALRHDIGNVAKFQVADDVLLKKSCPTYEISPMKQDHIYLLVTAIGTEAYKPSEGGENDMSSSTMFARYVGSRSREPNRSRWLPRHRTHHLDPPELFFQPGFKARPPRSICAPPDLTYVLYKIVVNHARYLYLSGVHWSR